MKIYLVAPKDHRSYYWNKKKFKTNATPSKKTL